jgi:hypothetical protein
MCKCAKGIQIHVIELRAAQSISANNKSLCISDPPPLLKLRAVYFRRASFGKYVTDY